MTTPKEWLLDKYSDKAELFDALMRLFRSKITDGMVIEEFRDEMHDDGWNL